MIDASPQDEDGYPLPRRLRQRLTFVALVLVALVVIAVTIIVLGERRTEAIRNQAELRLTLFAGNVMSELRRSSIVPQLLARDPLLSSALESRDYSQSSQRLIEYRDEIGVARLMLLDRDGRTVASSDRVDLGKDHRNMPYVVDALRADTTVFTSIFGESGRPLFVYSRKLTRAGELLGLITVEVDLFKYERSWDGISEAVIVKDSNDVVLLTTEPRWRGKTEAEALAQEPPKNALIRALRARTDVFDPENSVLDGQSVMRSEARIPFQGWRIISFSTYTPVRERVASVVAVQVMAFAILAAGLFYLTSRAAERRSLRLQRESAELRKLNLLLQREIAERQKAEKNLEVAEQTIAQSSKLAALGEMSAAVSHELNQPLAAMKTYLAGARLLVRRQRSEEAIVSFQRINDLIDRMAAITRQLKSYASKGDEATRRVDLRAAVDSSLAMMEPQFRQRAIGLTVSRPDTAVDVLGEQFRLEQVIVNLLRNAVDATRGQPDPQIDIILVAGDQVTLSVLDNGSGIADLEALFEPFYTTKAAGDGLGLGLAISSSIVAELGGRLTARNRPEGGAVFEMRLPRFGDDSIAAQ
ncbi:two-component system sensor histidine kinase [Meridianimarinicoccus roseus]|uniref:C4-dicarboxylate transport sensor protein DctB n=1 Tax=Meridianimarinicoccus roseus TaxID=2072018 RepID=A0A2V2LBR6_9RHOB|nr:ATP-binding protein [Meridianimarinicoccus roseus]PWR02950.1 two-component system sensor histidine kinase [Meridianimarinicoccus roseus]